MRFIAIWIWAAIPVWLAIQVPLKSSDFAWLPAYISAGLAAPAALYFFATITHPMWRVMAIVVALISAAWNITTAAGSSATHRQVVSEPMRDLIAKRESMIRRDQFLASQASSIGWRLNGQTSFSIEARIEQLKTEPHYIRTDGCTDLKASDPKKVCSEIAGAKGLLREAQAVEASLAEREQIRQQLLKVEAPTVADPQVDTIQRLLSFFMDVSDATVIAFLNGIGPVVAELIGTLMPPLVARSFIEHDRKRLPEVGEGLGRAREALGRLGSPPSLPPQALLSTDVPESFTDREDKLHIFIGEAREGASGSRSPTREVYPHYLEWCRYANSLTLPEREFHAAIIGCGVEKKKSNGRMCYVDFAIKPLKLKVVK